MEGFGLTPLHELPQELQIAEEADELTTLGGMITRDIGKIPLKGETFSFPFFDAEILDADETRVLNVKIKLKQGSKENLLNDHLVARKKYRFFSNHFLL